MSALSTSLRLLSQTEAITGSRSLSRPGSTSEALLTPLVTVTEPSASSTLSVLLSIRSGLATLVSLPQPVPLVPVVIPPSKPLRMVMLPLVALTICSLAPSAINAVLPVVALPSMAAWPSSLPASTTSRESSPKWASVTSVEELPMLPSLLTSASTTILPPDASVMGVPTASTDWLAPTVKLGPTLMPAFFMASSKSASDVPPMLTVEPEPTSSCVPKSLVTLLILT